MDEAGCNVTGCEETVHMIVEVGGGTCYGGRLATSTSTLRLCRYHAGVLARDLVVATTEWTA